MTDAAKRRLVVYCRRAGHGPFDYIADGSWKNHAIRHINADLRSLVWRDTEVRDALLSMDFDDVAKHVPDKQKLNLLDLMTGVCLEARLRLSAGSPVSRVA
jgi:hypothetical protein